MRLYAWFAYLGLMTVSASLLVGFRHDPSAPARNYLFEAALYLAYVAVHYVMMTPAIPIEERQLLRARGEEYRAYMEATR